MDVVNAQQVGSHLFGSLPSEYLTLERVRPKSQKMLARVLLWLLNVSRPISAPKAASQEWWVSLLYLSPRPRHVKA